MMMLGWLAYLSVAAMAPAPMQVQGKPQLAACLKAHMTTQDRGILVRWIFAGMARSALVQDMSKVSEEQRVIAMREAGKVIERLMIADCRAETVTVMKANGVEGTEEAFGQVGEAAMADLMTDSEVMATFAGIIRYVDMNALMKLLLDGGVMDKKK
ncbi:hypothetical protein [Sphingomonas elodea]|uniref:hypothetical protein n=1 Tax=Sphingomonas elodea TaxID=179878 RepID=UPI0002630FAA|nr:hypothetical protein [Sphingomonas elodea]